MTPAVAGTVVTVFGAYMAIGALVALVLVTFGAGRIDGAAKGMPIGARVLLFPGAMLLWPVVAVKLVTQKAPPIR